MGSLLYILPLIIASLLYQALSLKYRRVFIISVNILFLVAWGWIGAIVLLIISIATAACASLLSKKDIGGNKYILWISVIIILIPLFIAKDYLSITSVLENILQQTRNKHIVGLMQGFAPIGVSYYSFRAIGYVIDVYHERIKCMTLLDTIAFLSFYPHLLSGPIERASRFQSSLNIKSQLDYDGVVNGLILVAWGVFQKIAIADRLGLYVDSIYASPADFGTIQVVIAVYFFAVQIYCDFSGYTNIAIGLCGIMGFSTAINFKQPYMAKGISDFWNRWHISLSYWLRDYVFLPTAYGMMRSGAAIFTDNKQRDTYSYITAALLTMIICGIWHGATVTFVIWGTLHGVYMIFGRLTKNIRARLWRVVGLGKSSLIRNTVSSVVTFHLILVSWIIFRSESIYKAKIIIKSIISLSPPIGNMASGVSRPDFILALLFFFGIIILHPMQEKVKILVRLREAPILIRWAAYLFLIMAIEVLGVYDVPLRFLYVDF